MKKEKKGVKTTGETWKKISLFEDLMKISELDVDIPSLLYEEGLSRKEILEKIQNAAKKKIIEIGELIRNAN